MNTAFASVSENERLYGDTYLTWLSAPELLRGAGPGQFIMLRCSEPPLRGEGPADASVMSGDPLLPRAMSIHRVRQGANGPEWSILYDVVGRGTAWLASRKPGDLIFCWGPLGHGYEIDSRSNQLLLLAGGIGVAPLVWLADAAVEQGKSVMLVVGGRSKHQIFPAGQLRPEVEVVVTTEDGSLGRRGLATEAFSEYLEWSDQAFACGPHAMFAAMSDVVRQRRLRRSVQVLLEERMGCGTGICYGCAVSTKRGTRLVCKDGPMFDLRQVF